MNSIGFYTNFKEEANKLIQDILNAVSNKICDFAVYYDNHQLIQANSIPAFHSANLIHFTGKLIIFDFMSLLNASKVAYQATDLIYIYDSKDDINVVDLLTNVKSAKVFCVNQESYTKAKRIFGDNMSIDTLGNLTVLI